MSAQYYLIADRNNLARVVDRTSYEYLNKETGVWVKHAAVFDQINFAPDAVEITLAKAKDWVQRVTPTIQPIWEEELQS